MLESAVVSSLYTELVLIVFGIEIISKAFQLNHSVSQGVVDFQLHNLLQYVWDQF